MVGPPRMSLSIHFTSDLLTVLGGASAPNSLRYEAHEEVGPKLPSSGVCASSSSSSRFEFNCFFSSSSFVALLFTLIREGDQHRVHTKTNCLSTTHPGDW